MGLGWSSVLWHRSRPTLCTRYRTIALDNRGVGESSVPPGPYSIALMAQDAAAALDAAGVQSAHVFGVSMGGMIAQEFALEHPNRVRSLILGCTAAGGPKSVRAAPEVLDILMREGMSPNEFVAAINPFIYDSTTPPKRIEEDTALRLQWWPNPAGYKAQLQGILAWQAYDRLAQIQAPTLVIHDHLVPPANGTPIAGRIGGAMLVMIPQASHVLATDQPEAVNQAVLEFLATQHS